MNSGEKDYNIDAQSIFLDRRDELREHAAKGKGFGVDENVLTNLQRAADSLGHAVSGFDSGSPMAKIEKGNLLPTLDSIREACLQRDGISG